MKLKIILLLILLLSSRAFAECEKLSPAQCFHSKQCILYCNERRDRAGICDGAYLCREPKGHCEAEWLKREEQNPGNGKTNCESIAGCKYNAGMCLCPCDFTLPGEPGCNCACGGGVPANCKEK